MRARRYNGAKEAGALRLEGKEYVVQEVRPLGRTGQLPTPRPTIPDVDVSCLEPGRDDSFGVTAQKLHVPLGLPRHEEACWLPHH